MLPLPELQRRIAGAILTGDFAQATAVVAGDGLAAEARLRLYRNHFRITLADALAATFPATGRLLGQACLAGLARRFASAHPPADPCLAHYGAAFPAFLGRQPELCQVAYAPDLARLEWAMNRSREAQDLPALDAAALARLTPEALSALRPGLHPAWGIVRSRWPLPALWRACASDAGTETLKLAPAWTELLVGRDAEGDAVTLRLGPGASRFLRALRCGHELAAAAAAAGRREPSFDLAAMLGLCLEGGVLGTPSGHRQP